MSCRGQALSRYGVHFFIRNSDGDGRAGVRVSAQVKALGCVNCHEIDEKQAGRCR